MSKRNEGRFRPAPNTRLSKERAVPEHEMDPCAGYPAQYCPCPNGRTPLAIKGFDDKWRCTTCHRVHIELVYREAGESDPQTIDAAVRSRPTDEAVVKAREERMAHVRQRWGKGGEYYESEVASGMGMVLSKDDARRASDLAKSIPRGYGESDESYSSRVTQAYREASRERATSEDSLTAAYRRIRERRSKER